MAGRPLLIVVNGPPAAGKTTLARHLERALRLPLFTKDGFKEALYEIDDSEGWRERLADATFNAHLGAAAIRMMFDAATTVLAANTSTIVEANLVPHLAGPELAAIEERTRCRLLQVLVTAAPDVLIARYRERQRSEERHPGHRLVATADARVTAQLTLPWPPLAIDDTLEVDTTDLDALDYAPLLRQIRTRLAAA